MQSDRKVQYFHSLQISYFWSLFSLSTLWEGMNDSELIDLANTDSEDSSIIVGFFSNSIMSRIILRIRITHIQK